MLTGATGGVFPQPNRIRAIYSGSGSNEEGENISAYQVAYPDWGSGTYEDAWWHNRYYSMTLPSGSYVLSAIVITNTNQVIRNSNDLYGGATESLFTAATTNYWYSPGVHCFGLDNACTEVGYSTTGSVWAGDHKSNRLVAGGQRNVPPWAWIPAIADIAAINWVYNIETEPPPAPACNGVEPTLFDAGMEQQPNSEYWISQDPAAEQVAGRLGNSWTHALLFGIGPACGAGWQFAGTSKFITGADEALSVNQRFCWPGGTLYWKAKAAGQNGRTNLIERTYFYIGTAPDDLIYTEEIPLVDGQEWVSFGGQTDLGAGEYYVVLGDGGNTDGRVYWDDVQISDAPLDLNSCETNIIPGTPTPTAGAPTATPTLAACSLSSAVCGFGKAN